MPAFKSYRDCKILTNVSPEAVQLHLTLQGWRHLKILFRYNGRSIKKQERGRGSFSLPCAWQCENGLTSTNIRQDPLKDQQSHAFDCYKKVMFAHERSDNAMWGIRTFPEMASSLLRISLDAHLPSNDYQ